MRPTRVLLAFVCAIGLISPATAQNFVNPRQIPTSAFPSSIAVGDFNGDGIPDILWSQYAGYGSQGTFHVLLAQPNGSYTEVPTTFNFAVSMDPICRTADINHDGKDDLVCVGATGPVLYLSNGDGTFGTPTYTNFNFEAALISPPLNLNGDAFPDFVINNTYVLLGDGKGGFTLSYTFPQNQTIDPLIAADINGDGIPDLLDLQGPSVALGLGNGKFGPLQIYGANSTCTYADVDKDGHLDAACSHQVLVDSVDVTGVQLLTVQHGNADGSFNTQPFLTQTFGDTSNPYNGTPTLNNLFFSHDLNGDGLPDLIESSADGIGVLLGIPGHTFAYPTHFGVEYASTNGYVEPILVDMNGDGQLDLVTTALRSIVISYGKPDGTFATVPDLEVGKYVQASAVADFNNDGIPDVATAGDLPIEISIGKGDGTFLPYTSAPAGSTSFVTYNYGSGVIFAGDFNGDGKQDLIAAGGPDQYTHQPYFLAGNGDGTFKAPILISNGSALVSNTLQVADLNRDGRSDVFTAPGYPGTSAGQTPTLVTLLSNGDGTFNTVTTNVPSEPAANGYFNTPSPPRLADFNGDGKLDAAFAEVNNAYILLGHGDGSFDSTGVTLPIPTPAGYFNFGATSTTIGDFDGDGILDLAFTVSLGTAQYQAAEYTGLFVFYGNGSNTYAPAQLVAIFPFANASIQNADLRKEGRQELVLYGASIAEILLFHGTQSRTFDAPIPLVSNFSTYISIADLNVDGLLDLLVTAPGSNTVTPILNLGSTPTVTAALTASPEPSLVNQPFILTATLTPPTTGTLLTGTITFTVDGNPAGSATLTNNTASITIPGNLAIGQHTLAASWPGNTTYPALSISRIHTVVGVPTSTTIVSSLNPSTPSASVTFTATVANIGGVPGQPSGSVAFADTGTPLASIPLQSGTGTAAFTSASLATGTHTITASYSGDTSFATSSASLTQVVNLIQLTSSLTALPNPATVAQPVAFRYSIAGLLPAVPPTGTITITDSGTQLATLPIPASGLLTIPLTFASAGTHIITATYPGDANYAPTNASTTETITLLPTTLSLISSLNPSLPTQPVTFTLSLTAAQSITYSGQITLTDNGSPLATLPVSPAGGTAFTTSALTTGTHTIVASYSGVTSTLQPTTATPLQQVVNRSPSATTLTVSPSPAYQGQPVTLSAAVTTTSGVNPTGSINFTDGTVLIGSATVASGHATLTTSTLTPGTHLLAASYLGDQNTLASTSSPVSEQILSSDFTLSSNPTSLTLKTGHHTTFTFTATSVGAFTDQLQLFTGTLPPHVTILFSPASMPLATGGQATSSIYIDTDDVIGYLSQSSGPRSPRPSDLKILAAASLPWLALLLIPSTRRRRLTSLLLLALLAIFLTSATACSGKYPASTAPGNYTIQLFATGARTQTTHSVNISLTVTE